MKYYSTTAVCISLMLTMVGCLPDQPSSPTRSTSHMAQKQPKQAMSGEELYIKHCKICHGVDGSLGLNGAKDLRITEMNIEERIALVTKGKGAMTPFEKILSEDEIKTVANYTMKLKAE